MIAWLAATFSGVLAAQPVEFQVPLRAGNPDPGDNLKFLSVHNDALGNLYGRADGHLVKLSDAGVIENVWPGSEIFFGLSDNRDNDGIFDLPNGSIITAGVLGQDKLSAYNLHYDYLSKTEAYSPQLPTPLVPFVLIKPDGTIKWRQALPNRSRFVNGTAGVVWAASTQGLLRISESGVISARISTAQLGITASERADHIDALYAAEPAAVRLATRVLRADDPARSTISQLQTSGARDWTYTDSDPTLAANLKSSGADMLALGSTKTGAVALKLNASGQLLWRIRLGANSSLSDWIAEADGGFTAIVGEVNGTQTIPVLVRFSATGIIQQRTPFGPPIKGAVDGKLLAIDTGYLLHYHLSNQACSPTTTQRFFLFSSTGALRATKQHTWTVAHGCSRDETTLELANTASGLYLVNPSGEIQRLKPDLELDAKLVPPNRPSYGNYTERFTLLSDGAVFASTALYQPFSFSLPETQYRTLQVVEPNGAVRWSRMVQDNDGRHYFADHKRFIFYEREPGTPDGSTVMHCLDMATGNQIFKRTINGNRTVATSADFIYVLEKRGDGSSHLLKIDSIGALISDIAMLRINDLQLFSDGTQVGISSERVGDSEEYNSFITRIDSAGVVKWKKPILPNQREAGRNRRFSDVLASNDGALVIYVTRLHDDVERVDAEWHDFATGTTWQSMVPKELSSGDVSILENGSEPGALYLVKRRTSDFNSYEEFDRDKAVFKLNRQTGALLWSQAIDQDFEFQNLQTARLYPDERVVRIVGFDTYRDRVLLTLDQATGEVRDFSVLAASPAQVTHKAALAGDGVVSVETRVNAQGIVSSALRKSRFPAMSAALPNISRIGAWHHPSRPSQGLFIDVVGADPRMQQLFATWFTGSPYGAAKLEAKHQLWYSMLGEFPLGAKRVDLTIYRNAGGRFAQPPTTQGVPVGRARLHFNDCRRAVLEFQFDTSEHYSWPAYGAWQSMPLEALVLPSGQCATTPNTRNGAWYDPATSGQGLMLAIEESAATSTLFGGWFTYDPDGAADDAYQQTWLTLQGSLGTDPNSESKVKIYATVGSEMNGSNPTISHEVGEAKIKIDGCRSLQMNYRFFAGQIAAPFSNKTGDLRLSKIGGCP